MSIDLTTEEARRNYHKRTLEIMAKLERTLSNQVKPLINRQYMDAASLIIQGITDVEHVVNLQRARLQTILRTHYQRVAFTAGRQATRAFDPDKSMSDSFWNEINKYIALNTGRKVKTMQDTTIKNIKNQIKIGLEDGETNREIATRLRKKGKTLSTFQALRIARTETHGMYNSATEASVNDTGLKFTRVWSTSKDMRTRRRKKGSIYDHWVADGIKAKQGEDFIVSGESLSFPGDPKGSAGNIINCRCVLIYERDRSNEMQPKPISGALPVDVGLPVADSIMQPSTVDDFKDMGVFTNEEQVELYNKHFGIKPQRFIDEYFKVDGFKAEGRVSSYLEEVVVNGETVPSGTVRMMGQAVSVKDNSQYMSISREIRFNVNRTTGKTTREVKNLNFEISDPLQGKGLGKEIWKNAHKLHKVLKIEEVSLRAGLSNGGYAWSKFGFVPDKESWKELRSILIGKVEKSSIVDDKKKLIFRLLDSDDPKTIWKIADLNIMLDDGTKLSKKLLRGSGWDGVLDYSDKQVVTRLEKYIGYKND